MSAPASPTAASTSGRTCESAERAVKLGRLIDPLDGGVLAPAIVIVREGRIVAVETDEAKIPCGAQIIDWSAYSGVPGLVDAHTPCLIRPTTSPAASLGRGDGGSSRRSRRWWTRWRAGRRRRRSSSA
ncbi:hypothetical protein OV079_26600 [Nannocystis pusilla]|uniref:Uncharacterized protein n=1 Tax=Nannocystis pusilla TaxID=889268 RepID=A0A9X3ES16_9BACT|nr:hypothetical protein [Nannocystis pusilla]MCY1009067.1 hypothetical protein [Nannocystis pusilla]